MNIPLRYEPKIFAGLCLSRRHEISQKIHYNREGEESKEEYVGNKQIVVLSQVTILHSKGSHISIDITGNNREQDLKEVPVETKHGVLIKNNEPPYVDLIERVLLLVRLLELIVIVKQVDQFVLFLYVFYQVLDLSVRVAELNFVVGELAWNNTELAVLRPHDV